MSAPEATEDIEERLMDDEIKTGQEASELDKEVNDEEQLLKLQPSSHDLGVGTKDFNFSEVVIH